MQETVEYWRHQTPLEVMLAHADIAAEQTDPVAYLDSLREGEGLDIRRHCAYILSNLSAEAIFNNYGPKILAWATVNARSSEDEARLLDGLSALAGYDKELFKKAQLWIWDKSHSSNGGEVLSQYALSETLINNGLNRINLPKHLVESARPGVTLSGTRLKDYALLPIQPLKAFNIEKGWTEEFTHRDPVAGVSYQDVWLDTPVGFALMYKGAPNALVGLAMNREGSPMIYQLQGVKGKRIDPDNPREYSGRVSSRGLAPLDWQKLMIGITAEFVASLGIDHVVIQEGKQNEWANKILRNETKPHLSPEQAAAAYDAPAERLGFTQGDSGHWYKAL